MTVARKQCALHLAKSSASSFYEKYTQQDSNLQPLVPKTNALSN